MSENERIARKILSAACETEEIFEDYDMDLVEEGFLDSFAVLSIILGIKDETGIKLRISDIRKEDVCSINRMIRFLDGLAK